MSKESATSYKDRKYNEVVVIATKSGQVIRQMGCFAFMFTNIGDTVVTVNGMVIFPATNPATTLGDSRTVAAHENDLYMGFINVAFSAGGANPRVEIVQLFYTDVK